MFTISRIVGFFVFVLSPLFFIAPAHADYTCWNPAICIAVCGSETCKDSDSSLSLDRLKAVSSSDFQRELSNTPRNSSVRDAVSAILRDRGETRASYTCWNPAICIAVCGNKTCGE